MCHCLALRRASRHITRLYDAALRPVGLRISQFSLLTVIDNHPGIKISDFGQIMVMERTTLLRNLKPLQVAGMVTIDRAEGERGHVFKLTPKGKTRLEQAVPLWNAAQAGFEKKFGFEKAARLRDDNLAVGAISAL